MLAASPLLGDRVMRLGIVSDTHGHLEYTRQAIRVLERERVEEVIHCGDIGSHRLVSLFQEWPTHFVFGNVDDDEALLRAAIRDAGQTCHDRFGVLERAGCRIAVLHSDDRWRFEEAVNGGEFDLVCYGHTHIADIYQVGRTMVLNPGALYRADPHTLAIVELPALTAHHVSIGAEE